MLPLLLARVLVSPSSVVTLIMVTTERGLQPSGLPIPQNACLNQATSPIVQNSLLLPNIWVDRISVLLWLFVLSDQLAIEH